MYMCGNATGGGGGEGGWYQRGIYTIEGTGILWYHRVIRGEWHHGVI